MLNSTELGLKKFREYLKQVRVYDSYCFRLIFLNYNLFLAFSKYEPNQLYSFNTEFHHSGTFVPVNVDELEREQRAESKSRWKTLDGWTYPGVKTSMQSNEHPRKLDEASLERINEVCFSYVFKVKPLVIIIFVVVFFQAMGRESTSRL